jgi:hypothetical protein
LTNGTSAAVTEATRLGEIGFPEFTAKLITDTFDALVSANLRQTESYLELIKAVALSLEQYINETKDDIGGDMILQMLVKILPDPSDPSGTKVKLGGQLDAAKNDAKTLNDALTIPGKTAPTITDGAIDQAKLDSILDAVAERIAANKYDLLKQMVKMGVLRLVVEKGIIETKLIFTTYGSTFYEANKSYYQRVNTTTRKRTSTGGLVSIFVSAAGSTTTNKLTISTAKETNRDISGSQVQIYGHVQIEFKTDYSPMTT